MYVFVQGVKVFLKSDTSCAYVRLRHDVAATSPACPAEKQGLCTARVPFLSEKKTRNKHESRSTREQNCFIPAAADFALF